jgi:hypothetical protein
MSRYIDVTDIAKQIADFKKTVNSPNSDYMTGYLSALSVVEGMIANTPTANVAPIADTVRKMQERVEALFPSDKNYTTISRFSVKQIAKEMLGGEK